MCVRFRVQRLPTARSTVKPTPRPKTRDGQYRCATCGEKFKDERQLRCHELSHRERGRAVTVTCPKCQKKCAGPSGLATHIRLRHPEGTLAAGGFVCQHCGAKKKTMAWLKRRQTQSAKVYHGPCTAEMLGGEYHGRKR